MVSIAKRGRQVLRRRGKYRTSFPLQSLLTRGSQILQRLMRVDPNLVTDARPTWDDLSIAYASTSEGDARTALTRLQTKLHQWTSEDANVAADETIQRYRQLLHSVLDHGEQP